MPREHGSHHRSTGLARSEKTLATSNFHFLSNIDCSRCCYIYGLCTSVNH